MLAKQAATLGEVTVISLNSATESKPSSEAAMGEFSHYMVDIHSKGRMLLRWREFYKGCIKLLKSELENAVFDNLIASDLYALPVTSYIRERIANVNLPVNHVYDSREVYSALGSLSGRPISQRIITRIEQKYLSSVDRISISGERDLEYVRDAFPNTIQYFVIKNYPPFRPIVKNDYLRNRFKIPDNERIAIYQGAVSKGRSIEKSILAFKQIPEWHLCIVGGGPEFDDYKSLGADVPNVHFTGMVPFEDLHSITCSADLGLSLIEPISLSYKFALPNKLFEYFMAGLPVLATDMPPILEVMEAESAGLVLRGNLTPVKIQNSISSLRPADLVNFAEKALQARENYNYQSQSAIISELLKG